MSSPRFFIFVVMFRAIVFIFYTIGVSVTEARIGHRELGLLRKPYPLGDERGEFEGEWSPGTGCLGSAIPHGMRVGHPHGLGKLTWWSRCPWQPGVLAAALSRRP